jgi:Peptidase C13 family
VGLGGEKKYSDAFREMAASMVVAAEKRLGLDPAHIVSLGEKESTRESVEKALREVAARSAPGDVVLILLIGHGSFQQGESRFNLRGPDMRAADFVPLLDALASRRVVFVNTASASGDFVKPLMGRNRTIVTATKSAQERNETAFARHFVDAFATGGADADKDQRVSVLEAFEYARREVQRFYEKERRLLTEHAVLEDGREGALARTVFLGSADGETQSADAGDPELAALRQERREVERRLDALKARKETTAAASYEEELEKLLLELARKDAEARRRAAEKKR